MICKCGARLLGWHVDPWPLGWVVQRCDRRSCHRRHYWAANLVELYAFLGYVQPGRGCEVRNGAGAVVRAGECVPLIRGRSEDEIDFEQRELAARRRERRRVSQRRAELERQEAELRRQARLALGGRARHVATSR